MTRKEHINWCKKRALEYVEVGDYKNAIASMLSDLGKHEKTKDHIGIIMGVQLQMMGELSTYKQVKDFIEGFN